MDKRSIVLLSGGLDSAVNYKKALDSTQVVLALTFDYGQDASDKEISATRYMVKKFGTPHQIIRLDFMKGLDSGLNGGTIPDFDPEKLDEKNYSLESAKAVWVPNRNGLFINVAAAFAEQLKAGLIITGFNKEEGATFPDNTPEFMDRINRALEYSTMNRPRVMSYTSEMTKKEIVAFGKTLSAPFEHIWSCYHDLNRMCGKCESCRRLKRALSENGLLDAFNKTNRWGFQ